MRPILPLMLFLLAGDFGRCSFAQKQSVDRRVVAVPTTSTIPASGFSLSSTIGFRLKLPDGPVKIVGLGNGPAADMSTVVIENASTRRVKAIRLIWYLFNDPNSTNVVKTGRTRQIKPGILEAGQSKMVESKIPGLDELFKGLTRDGYIEGAWFLEATVGEVEYSDGTKWRREAAAQSSKRASN